MNIDIINRQVANNLNIKEAKVKLINQYYWHNIKQSLYNYSSEPISIEGICCIYPDKKLVKANILDYLKRIRNVRKSAKFLWGSEKQISYIEKYTAAIRHLLRIRKHLKFTN
jgi:hypothetical protein